MSFVSSTQPQLLRQLNERSVLRVLQAAGPCSRAEVTRRMGVTAPTVSKAVASLLQSGLLEEIDAPANSRGRPAKRLRLATQTAQVLGLVIDADDCQLVAAGLEGRLIPGSELRFKTPSTYERLIEETVQRARRLIDEPVLDSSLRRRDRSPGVQTLGLGISMPGLIDSRKQRGLLSPNVPVTDGHSPGHDLSRQLGLECVLLQECHALCLGERHYGDAQGLDNFAMVDATTGVGLGVMTGGRLLTGDTGLAGELGHLPVEPNGHECGCGRRGCLETTASDAALTRLVSRRRGCLTTMDDILNQNLLSEEFSIVRPELDRVTTQLAFALATVINLFNPATLFICSRMFEIDVGLFDRLVTQTASLALQPSFGSCRIQQARGSKREGAVAGIIHYLTDSRVQVPDRGQRF